MSALHLPSALAGIIRSRPATADDADDPTVRAMFHEVLRKNHERTSHMFRVLMVVQWLVAITFALLWAPRTWSGASSSVHVHLFAAVVLGGCIGILPIVLTTLDPRGLSTRVVVTIAQMSWSALLIHLSGGRIETHFHVFGSLAFVAFYRDWRLLLVASGVVAIDHLTRQIFWPESVFGVSNPEWWRALEHASWVAFEDVILIVACVRGVHEARGVAMQTLGEIRTRQARAETDRVTALARGLDAKNADLQRVLDHVGDGLIVVDGQGRIADERSKVLETWFGEARPGRPIWEYLGAADAAFGVRLETGWTSIDDGALPLELSLDQLPKLLRSRGRLYAMRPIPVGVDASSGFLIAIEDTTSAVEQQEADLALRDLTVALDQLVRDRNGFAEFLGEASLQVVELATSREATPHAMRTLHTLKGNCAAMGFEAVAAACHEIEDHVAETGDWPHERIAETLGARWQHIEEISRKVSGHDGAARLTVDRAEIESLGRAVGGGASGAELAERVAQLTMAPLDRIFANLADQTQALCTRRGLVEARVETCASDIRVDADAWTRFFSAFVHVMRNAVVHGLEGRDRSDGAGRVSLRACATASTLEIVAQDDGAGIDWEGIARRAADRGLAHGSHAELVSAMFRQGISTRDETTTEAGRGVGLAAIEHETAKLGGTISIESKRGRGTTFAFTFHAPRDPAVRRPWSAGHHEGALSHE